MHISRTCLLATVAAIATVTVLVPSAQATMPGQNGKIAFVTQRTPDDSIYTANPDGTGESLLIDRDGTDSLVDDLEPAWSPDGNRLLFSSVDDATHYHNIWEVFSDGTGARNLAPTLRPSYESTWSPDGWRFAYSSSIQGLRAIFVRDAYTGAEYELTRGDATAPSWSPDGSKIAFQSRWDVWTINVDGSNPTNITNTPEVGEGHPDWSPDGSKLVYTRDSPWRLVIANPDGTGETTLQDPVGLGMFDPVWSPDGTRIAFSSARDGDIDVYTIRTDGSGLQQVTNHPATDWKPSWQPITSAPTPGYVRPQGASPMVLSLVTAFRECTAPNRVHGPPLESPSCTPPSMASRTAVGTPDSGGGAANFVGSVRLTTIRGTPGGQDDADVSLSASLTDVRCRFSGSPWCADANSGGGPDYAGELRADLPIRITDKDNTMTPDGSTIGTVRDQTLSVPIECAANSNAAVGSTCSLSTTLDALIPGAVKEGRRALWQLQRVQVYDGGDDGDASTADGEARFATQGVFVP